MEAVGLNPTPTLKKFGNGSMNAPLPLVCEKKSGFGVRGGGPGRAGRLHVPGKTECAGQAGAGQARRAPEGWADPAAEGGARRPAGASKACADARGTDVGALAGAETTGCTWRQRTVAAGGGQKRNKAARVCRAVRTTARMAGRRRQLPGCRAEWTAARWVFLLFFLLPGTWRRRRAPGRPSLKT